MTTNSSVVGHGKTSLPLIDMDAELKRFEAEERKRLGLDTQAEQWIEDMAGLKTYDDSGQETNSIWPAIYPRLLELIRSHRSTSQVGCEN